MRARQCVGLLLALFAIVMTADVRAQAASQASEDPGVLLRALDHATPAQLEAFLRKIDAERYDDAKVGAGKVIDRDGNGTPELLVSLDPSGRGFYNELHILYPEGQRMRTQILPVWKLESLDGVVEDLDGDARLELILPEDLTPYRGGADPLATWRAVYTLEGGKYLERSARFRSFYEKREIPRLLHAIDEVRTVPGGKLPEASYRVEALEIERDKIYRVEGGQPKAGLASALGWAKSSDPRERTLAAGILSDIGDPEADQALLTLSRDRDTQVATLAGAAKAYKEAAHKAH
jgi:hypothetical protein